MKSRDRFRFPSIQSSTAVQLFVTFLVIYAITSSGGLESADSEMRYRTAKSWLDGQGGALPAPFHVNGMLGRDGRAFSMYGPFQSMLMLPFVALTRLIAPANAENLFKLVFGVIVIPAISAMSLTILFRALCELGFTARAAFGAVALIGLATPLWHYGRSGQEENIIGLALALYLWGMGLLFRERFEGLILIGLAASIIVSTRWSQLPTLAIISIPVLWSLWQRRTEWRKWRNTLAIGSALVIATAGIVLWYNNHRFGRPFETGYGLWFKLNPPFFAFRGAPSHMLALIVSPYRGLVWFCPALLLLLRLKNRPQDVRSIPLGKASLGAWLFTWVFIGSLSIWSSAQGWGPRYLVGLIVLLAPAFATVLRFGPRWRGLIAISILVQFCSTLLPPSSEDFLYDKRNFANPGTCNEWKCECSALCLRGPWALRAIRNTISSRALPTVDLNSSSKAPGAISPLETSDFNAVYWWPVRAAYRAHKLSPALAFTICLFVLAMAFGALWFCYRRLREFPSTVAGTSS